ncbi:MAG: VOC family protein [Bryobacterales bacterium]|nr:VOC family protein [Bryobacterales bacterium]MBV9399968.1 VOC family protein [Bryobacterales bacterium]
MCKLAVSAALAASFALAQTKAPAGDVTGVGNFSHIVADLDKSLAFYRVVLGLEPVAPPRPFDPNPAIMKLGNTLGAQSRMVQLRVPGSELGVEIIEYKDIDRNPAHPRFQDPGAANLIVRFRDLDSVLARVKNSQAHILSAGGSPGAVRGSRVIFIQDPDGFICELSGPETPAGGTGPNVTGGGFEVTVNDAGKIGSYYKPLGFDTIPVSAFNADKLMTDTAGTPGAQFRQTRAVIPGTSAFIGYIEFKDIDRKPLQTRVQDPGTAILQLTVRDLDSFLPKLKSAGFTVVSTGGEPVDIGPNARIALVRDPNNLFLELIQRRAAPPK